MDSVLITFQKPGKPLTGTNTSTCALNFYQQFSRMIELNGGYQSLLGSTHQAPQPLLQHFLEPSQSSSVLHVITQAGGWCFGQEPDFTVDYDRKHHRNRGLLESSVMPQFYYYESVQLINKKTL